MLSTQQTTAIPLAAFIAAVLLCGCIGPTQAQENIQLQIPNSLVECYNTSYYMNRDNRLPANIDTLITLIEKVENYPSYTGDIRTLAIGLLQRFRQDGIQRAPGVIASDGVIPYSPTGFQFPKFRILLSRLIPGNALTFPNSSLTAEERCSMHFMLSSSFQTHMRGDENQVCSQLSQYRSERLTRRAVPQQNRNNFIGDVEVMQTLSGKAKYQGAAKKFIQMNTNTNAKSLDYDYGLDSDYGTYDNTISQCPVENGVIWTPWGTVSAGTLIAGIAAGLQPQSVQLRTLLALSKRRPGSNLPQTTTVNIDNRWASTLAGDLAEVALVQVPITSTDSASVGANGAWNSTVMPKWYFLSQRQNLEMTDAEIRGGIDGLVLAMNVATWRTQASTLKLSQLLRMYYSMDGVLSSGIMACNRKENFATVAPLATMIAQTSAFAQVLDREMQLHVTLTPGAIANFSMSAANALTSYVPQYLNDVSCSVSSALPQEISESITPITNLYVFLDTSWQYATVLDYVTYILQRVNVNPYASNVTLLSASDCSVIVNTTNYLSDIYQGWNITTHSWYTPGFNLPTILRTIQNLTQTYMASEQANSSVGGQSMVALLIPYQTSISAADSSYATTQLQYIYEQIPDLQFIYYTGSSVNNFQSFVRDPTTDLFPLSTGANVASSSGPVVMRIRKIPRRIINPRCGPNWSTSTWGTDQMYQYVMPNSTNFYRIMPNYFFGSTTGRYVNILSQNSLKFTICTSRTTVLPMQNSSSSAADQNCIDITGSNGFSYDLSNGCNDYSYINQCPPLYISVQSANDSTSTVSCIDAACQSPNQEKYQVQVVNLGCFSGVAGLLASITTMILACSLGYVLQ